MRHKNWKGLSLTAAGIAAVVVIGGLLLFSGSEVTCAEVGTGESPELRCEFEVAASPDHAEAVQAFVDKRSPRFGDR